MSCITRRIRLRNLKKYYRCVKSTYEFQGMINPYEYTNRYVID